MNEKYSQLFEIVTAVAHVGIDFGYGAYELTPDIIEKARKIIAESTPEVSDE